MSVQPNISSDLLRVVAFVAWRLITGREGVVIYDHAHEKRVEFSGMISDTTIDLRDPSGQKISGAGGSGMYTLSAGTGGKPVTLKISGLEFEGFDYGTSSRYRGTVDRQNLSIREGRDDRAYDFSIPET